MPSVTLIMPCLNEAETIQQCIMEAQAALKIIEEKHRLTGEIVIADNGSTDGSIEMSQGLGARVVHVPNKGYGNALRCGIESAKGSYIVMADSDGSYDFEDAVPIIDQLLQGYELVMGNRFKGDIRPGAMPWKNRYIGNPLLSGILNLLFKSGLGDAHSGIRGFTKDAYERMRLSSSGMEFASEMVIKATLLDLKRVDVPVTLRPDGRSRPPHLKPWRDGWRHLRYLFMLSPMWLYFIPASVAALLGAFILALLLANPSQLIVDVGPIWFGDHWITIAGGLLVAAHQAVIFGIATLMYGIREGYRIPSPTLVRLYHFLNLEIMLIGGIVAVLVGFTILAIIFASWSSQGFGPLSRFREIGLASTLMLIGLQNFFGGFLFAIINGNEANVSQAIKDAAEKSGKMV